MLLATVASAAVAAPTAPAGATVVTLSVTAEKKGGDENLEIVFILPRDVRAIKLGTARFISPEVAIPTL